MRKPPSSRSAARSLVRRLLGLALLEFLVFSCQNPDATSPHNRTWLASRDEAITNGDARLQGTIAFHSSRDGPFQLYVMNADGTDPRRLLPSSDFQFDPSFSPDGSRIAINTFPPDFSSNNRILLVDAAGTVTQLNDGSSADFCCAWSPDGKQVAFKSNRDGVDDAYIMTLATKTVRRLTTNAYVANVTAWSPDGKYVAYSSYRDYVSKGPAGDIDLFIIDVKGEQEIALTDNDVDDEGDFASWSPDGKRFVFSSRRDGGHLHIFLMNLDRGKEVTQLTFPDPQNLSDDDDPTWSPDGQYIAFQSTRDGDEEVYVMNLRTHETKQLTRNTVDPLTGGPIFDAVPAWTRRPFPRPSN